MGKRTLLGIAFLATFAAPAWAQSLYRCQEGSRTTYSDRACTTGPAVRMQVEVGPSIEEQSAARSRLKQSIADFDARRAARLATAPAAKDGRTKEGAAKLQASDTTDEADSCATQAVTPVYGATDSTGARLARRP